ncbi:MAG: winged helix-turn-helix domain-containing protein [Myxococcales bacterium]|nr:winged helix-turn-helix domain-containing protein [Myxococcales bacterium]
MADVFRFGPHEVDVQAGELRVQGEPVPLQPLPWKLLVHLVERPGQLVSRHALLQVLWPDQVAVSDESLGQVISRLRRALHGTPLKTVPRRGYRLEASVEAVGEPSAPTLFGRQPEREAVQRAWQAAPIVTLTGPAGVGKTAIARSLVSAESAFVDLSRATSRADLLGALCHALSTHVGSGDDARVVVRALQGSDVRRLVLDNAETVLCEVRDVLRALVGALGAVRVLVTSRVVLGLPEERVVEVPPLPAQDARKLFEHHLARLPDEPLEPLVDALDGLPLAIELCVPRLRLQSPSQLVSLLHRRFELLATSRGEEARHRSLRAALDDSWSLLTQPQRRALSLLVAWVAPFSVEQAETVLDPEGPTFELLQGLRDHSWLSVGPDGRLHVLPTLREYVVAQADPDALHAGYWRHAVQIVRDLGPVMAGGPMLSNLDPAMVRLSAMPFDTIEAARRCVTLGNGELAGPCAVAAYHVLVRTGPIPVLRRLLERARPLATPRDRPLLGRLLADVLVWFDAVDDALQVQRTALEQAEQLDDPALVRFHQAGLAMQLFRASQHREAIAVAQEVLSDRSVPPASETSMWAREVLVWGANEDGRFDDALEVLQQMYQIAADAGLDRSRTRALRSMGIAHERAGRYRTALGCYDEVLQSALQSGREQATVDARINVGAMRMMAGPHDIAETCLDDALAAARRRAPRKLVAVVLQHRGRLEIERDRPAAALPWLEESMDVLRTISHQALELEGRGLLSVAHVELGDPAAALAQLALARALRDTQPGPWPYAWWLWQGQAHWRAQRFSDALACADEVLDQPVTQTLAELSLGAWCLRAAAVRHVGTTEEADAAKASARERFERMELSESGWLARWMARATA